MSDPPPVQNANSDPDADPNSSVVIKLGQELSDKVQNKIELEGALRDLGVSKEALICQGTHNDFEPNTVVITQLQGSASMRGYAANVAAQNGPCGKRARGASAGACTAPSGAAAAVMGETSGELHLA